MVGFYNYTVWMTYVSLACGVAGIFSACKGHPLIAVILLMASGVLDLFDGKIARTKKDRTLDEKKYGIQIDSLSDLVCFGILPIAIGYSLGMNHWYDLPIVILFVLSGLVRLAYFNVLEEHRQEEQGKPVYIGLPITSSSIFAPAFYLISRYMENGFEYVYLAFLFLLSVFYVVRIKIPKPSNKVSIIGTAILGVLYIAAFVLTFTLWKK